jgi:hypothetical protein
MSKEIHEHTLPKMTKQIFQFSVIINMNYTLTEISNHNVPHSLLTDSKHFVFFILEEQSNAASSGN